MEGKKVTFENHIMSAGFNKMYTKDKALEFYLRLGEIEILTESDTQCTFRYKDRESFMKARERGMMLYNNG